MDDLRIKKKSLAESEAVIKSNESLVGVGLWNIGAELKIIRNSKSYQEKGYENFEEYTEKELNYSKRHINRFIQIADNYSGTSMSQIGNFGINKLLSLARLPEPERNDFIEQNNVNEMTSRELQAAIKAKKEAEEKANRLESENNELRNTKQKEIIKTVEKEVIPKDYHTLKDKVFKLENSLESKATQLRRLEEDKQLLEKKVKLNEKESQEYQELKRQIDLLKKKKQDFKRQIEAVTELSGLVVKVENFLKQELAPIKYSRAIEEQKHDEIVQRNLQDIISRVYNWCDEMNQLINNGNHYNTEVIDYAE